MYIKDQIAVVKRFHAHFLIGGGLEGDETHLECLKREFKEEVGFSIKNVRFLETCVAYQENHQNEGFQRLIGHIHQVDFDQRLDVMTASNHQLTWLKVSEMTNELCISFQNYAAKKYLCDAMSSFNSL